jgi:hypothetical protein
MCRTLCAAEALDRQLDFRARTRWGVLTALSRLGSAWSRTGAAVAPLTVACSAAQRQGVTASGGAEACARARELRREAAELHAGGKVDRAHRTLDAANVACADDRASSWGLELEILLDLGLEPEASALAREIAGSSEASAPDAAHARAWLAAPPEGTPTRSTSSPSRRMARRSRAWPATRRHASGT